MKFSTTLKMAALLVATTSLSACFGSGTGGGGGGAGGGGGDFDTNLAAVQGILATTTVITGTADYTGQVEILTGQNPGNMDESLIGDLDMNINFDANSRPITATASNFAGEVNGTQVTLGGSLSTGNAPTGINDIGSTTIPVPVVGGTITTTVMSAELRGQLTDPTGELTGGALMTLQGTFVGDNGAGVFGAAGVILDPPTGPNIITGGSWYANRD